MRDALLKSFIRVLLVWFTLLFLYWGIQDAEIAGSVQRMLGKAMHVTPLNALAWLWFVVEHWTFPVLGAVVAAFLVGYGLTHGIHWRRGNANEKGVSADPSWRGMNVTLGWLPHPSWEMKEPELAFDFGDLSPRVKLLPSEHRAVLEEILSVLSAYPAGSVFVGPGHTDSLLEHTLNVLEPLWADNPRPDHLLPLLAAAHDMGKIRAWVKTTSPSGDATWRRNGWHDEWSARLFSGLPSFWTLPAEDRQIALLALRYGHKFSKAPNLPMQQMQRLIRLHEQLEGADRRATAQEKQAVMEANVETLPELLTQAFLDALTESLPFYTASKPKGVKAAVWRRNSRLYISEWHLREALPKHLPENIAAAIETSRKPGDLSPITVALIDALRVQGWLVEALPEPGSGPESDKPAPLMIARPPLWNVRAGSINLSGVLIVNIPVELQHRLGGNSAFPILTLCPLYDGSGRKLDSKNLIVPLEYLEASEAENNRPMKPLEDAEMQQQPDSPVKAERAKAEDSALPGIPLPASPAASTAEDSALPGIPSVASVAPAQGRPGAIRDAPQAASAAKSPPAPSGDAVPPSTLLVPAAEPRSLSGPSGPATEAAVSPEDAAKNRTLAMAGVPTGGGSRSSSSGHQPRSRQDQSRSNAKSGNRERFSSGQNRDSGKGENPSQCEKEPPK